MASLVYAPFEAAEFDRHGDLYRGVYKFLCQFVDLLEIDRR